MNATTILTGDRLDRTKMAGETQALLDQLDIRRFSPQQLSDRTEVFRRWQSCGAGFGLFGSAGAPPPGWLMRTIEGD